MSLVRSRLVTAAVTGALAVTGLAAVTSTSASAVATTTIRVHITRSSVVRMPVRMRPGVKRFRVSAARDASFQLLRPRRGYTKREAAHDVNVGLNQGNVAASRRFEANTTLVGGVEARRGQPGVMWEKLDRGRYWALDTDPDTIKARKIRTIRVRGPRRSASVPRPDAVIRAVGDQDWAGRPASIPRRGVLSWRNQSEQNHFIVLVRLRRGKTVKDFKAWVDKANSGRNPGRPPVVERGGVFSGALDPHQRQSMRYSTRAGKYVLACFWPDTDNGGIPHAFIGMYRGITLR